MTSQALGNIVDQTPGGHKTPGLTWLSDIFQLQATQLGSQLNETQNPMRDHSLNSSAFFEVKAAASCPRTSPGLGFGWGWG